MTRRMPGRALAACCMTIALAVGAQSTKPPALAERAPGAGAPPATPAAAAATANKAPSPDPAAMKAATRAAGKKAAEFCGNCHGEDGNSKASDVPNMAGQNRTYLLREMQKYVSGERKNKFKEGLMKLLPAQDLPAIAAYYAESPVVLPRPKPDANAAQGQAIYQRYCGQCHGADAYGSENMPRLAGQQVEYIQVTLKRYRDRSGERVHAPMAAITGVLKDKDIDAVASHLASTR